ncbi:MAG TPA: phosphatase PAP2 family protein [Bryobacteraceae bacterium]|nr:phosphatase PAP2 family protein [Bryobacteraceae bacterium]
MSRSLLSTRAGRLSFWLGGGALAFLAFVRITRELLEGDVGAMDNAILLAVAKTRTPWLTSAAIDVTALGSITLVVLFSVFTLVVLLVLRDRWGAIQLMAASIGAGLLTVVTKDIIERTRPEQAERLIAVSGFSYPSGHSLSTSALYITIAIIACSYVQHSGARAAILLAVSVVILMVGASRVYLGVHYATDVASGLSLGAAWALLLAGLFTLLNRRGSP